VNGRSSVVFVESCEVSGILRSRNVLHLCIFCEILFIGQYRHQEKVTVLLLRMKGRVGIESIGSTWKQPGESTFRAVSGSLQIGGKFVESVEFAIVVEYLHLHLAAMY
jgi:hypothetical protein